MLYIYNNFGTFISYLLVVMTERQLRQVWCFYEINRYLNKTRYHCINNLTKRYLSTVDSLYTETWDVLKAETLYIYMSYTDMILTFLFALIFLVTKRRLIKWTIFRETFEFWKYIDWMPSLGIMYRILDVLTSIGVMSCYQAIIWTDDDPLF